MYIYLLYLYMSIATFLTLFAFALPASLLLSLIPGADKCIAWYCDTLLISEINLGLKRNLQGIAALSLIIFSVYSVYSVSDNFHLLHLSTNSLIIACLVVMVSCTVLTLPLLIFLIIASIIRIATHLIKFCCKGCKVEK